MITKTINENSIAVSPQDTDDLLNIRRIIVPGDTIVGDTTRVIKQERDYARPDKGERVKIRIAITVQKVSLDVLDRLRIVGTITESSNESIPHGSHHSLAVQIGNNITISKRHWSSTQRRLLKSDNKIGFVLIAIDTSDCGIARLYGTHLEFLPNIYSGAGGKRYKTNYSIEKFFDNIQRSIQSTLKKVAKNLVNEQLCACVNIIEISSIYRWEGKIEDTSEYMAIFKTTSTNRSALKERIAKTHPYDVPEIAELDVLSLNDSYLKWLSESS